MTKDELKKEAEESAEKFFGKPTDLVDLDNLRIFKNGYLASAEPREKRIAELEKENAELKDYRLTTLAKQQAENQKYTVNLEHKLSWYDDQLTKAKEIIKEFMKYEINEYDGSLEIHFEELKKQAEQFLSEVEK